MTEYIPEAVMLLGGVVAVVMWLTASARADKLERTADLRAARISLLEEEAKAARHVEPVLFVTAKEGARGKWWARLVDADGKTRFATAGAGHDTEAAAIESGTVVPGIAAK